MLRHIYPPLISPGWHLEAGWDLDTFGFVLSLTWGHGVAVRLGWGYLLLWHDGRRA